MADGEPRYSYMGSMGSSFARFAHFARFARFARFALGTTLARRTNYIHIYCKL